MDRVKGRFGFGFMRPPMKDGEIDYETYCRMVDAFLDSGFNYFDMARCYMDGQCEKVMRRCLTSRYPRESYVLTDKLSPEYLTDEAGIRPLFAQQLEDSGVEYFDYYLMHAQTAELFAKYKRCRAYETALQLKEEGKIRHMGISFHDKPEVLEQILTEYPEIEVVQIQFNYLDYEDPAVESRRCYEVCRRFEKPVLVMEPVKGGSLTALPPEAQKLLQELGGSPASDALRFVAGFEGIEMILSGMSSLEQVEENTSLLRVPTPLSETEMNTLEQVRNVIKGQHLVGCTACRYCVKGCPKQIPIPDLFACFNAHKLYHNWNSAYYYEITTTGRGKASDCIACGKCEKSCPQHLPIRQLLQQTAQAFESEEK